MEALQGSRESQSGGPLLRDLVTTTHKEYEEVMVGMAADDVAQAGLDGLDQD
jgi:hypothetical protein